VSVLGFYSGLTERAPKSPTRHQKTAPLSARLVATVSSESARAGRSVGTSRRLHPQVTVSAPAFSEKFMTEHHKNTHLQLTLIKTQELCI